MPLDPSEQRLKDGSPVEGGGSIDPHSSTHEAGGSDEVSVATSLLVDDAVTSAKIASDSVTNTQVDNSDSFNWTNVHQWTRTVPSSGTNTWTSYVNSTDGVTWSWNLNANGNLALYVGTTEIGEIDNNGDFVWTSRHDWESDSSTGTEVIKSIIDTNSGNNARWVLAGNGNVELRTDARTFLSFPLGAGSTYTSPERLNLAGGAAIEDAYLAFGNSDEFWVEYQSGDDALAIRDQTNSADRVQIDRTTGDITTEGVITEGGTL